MTIKRDYIQLNEYSRPGRKIAEVLGIVMHWTAAPRQSAHTVHRYFADRRDTYGSAHYIIDQCGLIVQAIPEDEIAYHCGSATYTEEAQQRYGKYCFNHNSPNNCTIGVELCPVDDAGNFSTETITAAVELCADLCRRYDLQPLDITTHHDVVGWKNCPKLWTEKPALFEAFKYSVGDKLARS